jgi:hypothetical protein
MDNQQVAPPSPPSRYRSVWADLASAGGAVLAAIALGVAFALAYTGIVFYFPTSCDIACFLIPIFGLVAGVLGNLIVLLFLMLIRRWSMGRRIAVLAALNLVVLWTTFVTGYVQSRDQLGAYRASQQQQKLYAKAATVQDCAALTQASARPSCLIGKVHSQDDFSRCQKNSTFSPDSCRVAYAQTVGDITLCNGLSTGNNGAMRGCVYDLVWGGTLAQKIPNETAAVQCHQISDSLERAYCSLFVLRQFDERHLDATYSYIPALCSDIPNNLAGNHSENDAHDNDLLLRFCGPGHQIQ